MPAALIVTDGGTLNTAEQGIADRLELTLGWTVDVRDDNTAPVQADDEAAYDLILFTGTTSLSTGFPDDYLNHAVFMVVAHNILMQEFGFGTGDEGSAVGEDTIEIVDNTHPITSGFSLGALLVFSAVGTFEYIKTPLASGAVTLATRDADATRVPLVLLEDADSPSGRARMNYYYDTAAPGTPNADHWALFDQIVDYAAPAPPPTISSYTADPTTTSSGGSSDLTVVASPGTSGNTLEYLHEVTSGTGATLVNETTDVATLTGTASGTETTHTVRVTVTEKDDGGNVVSSAQATVDVVESTNNPPVAEAQGDVYSHVGDPVNWLAVDGSDPEGDPLTWSAEGLPPSQTIDPDTGYVSGTIQASDRDNAPYAVTITISDGIGEDSESFQWDVRNRDPVVNAGSNDSVEEGAAYSHAVSATDQEGDPITLGATGLPAGLSMVDNGGGDGEISGTPDPGTEGDHIVTVTATDTYGGSGEDTYTLTITAFGVTQGAWTPDDPLFVTTPAGTAYVQHVLEGTSYGGGRSVFGDRFGAMASGDTETPDAWGRGGLEDVAVVHVQTRIAAEWDPDTGDVTEWGDWRDLRGGVALEIADRDAEGDEHEAPADTPAEMRARVIATIEDDVLASGWSETVGFTQTVEQSWLKVPEFPERNVPVRVRADAAVTMRVGQSQRPVAFLVESAVERKRLLDLVEFSRAKYDVQPVTPLGASLPVMPGVACLLQMQSEQGEPGDAMYVKIAGAVQVGRVTSAPTPLPERFITVPFVEVARP